MGRRKSGRDGRQASSGRRRWPLLGVGLCVAAASLWLFWRPPNTTGGDRGKEERKEDREHTVEVLAERKEDREHTVEVLAEFPHDTGAFTQGLLWSGDEGVLYESTGMYGDSDVRAVDLRTGKVLRRTDCHRSDFGEGLTVHSRDGAPELLQLTWRSSKCNRYSLPDLRFLGSVHTAGLNDAWGLTTTGAGELLLTDGSTSLFWLNDALQVTKRVTVTDGGTPITMLNELEWIPDDPATPWGPDPVVYANVFGKDCVARIDPTSGKVRGWVLMDHVAADRHIAERHHNRVLNGIAYSAANRTLLVTGKYWPSLYEVRLVPSGRPGKKTRKAVRDLCVPAYNVFGK